MTKTRERRIDIRTMRKGPSHARLAPFTGEAWSSCKLVRGV